MKSKITFLFFLIAFPLNILFAQTNQGIHFVNTDFDKVVALAKAQNKAIFVEVYLIGCPHCAALEPVLSEKAVGNVYNKSFINWRIEANSKESQAFQKSKGVSYPEFPLFFYLDKTGNLIHFAAPAEKPSRKEFIEEVISHANTALNPQLRASSYESRFKSGEKDVLFLINYGKYCKTLKDTLNLHKINTLLGNTLVSPDDIASPVGFYIIKRLIDDFDNPLAQYFFIHLDLFNSKFDKKEVKEAAESIIYFSLYGSKLNSVDKIVQMREYMKLLGVAATDAESRTLLKELEAYFRAKNTNDAAQRFNAYRQSNTRIGVEDYAYLMHFFNEKAPDNSYLAFMPAWASDGLKKVTPEKANTQVVANVYYELAVAYLKQGNKAEALTNAQKALEIAKKAKIELKAYEDLKSQLEK